MANKSSNVPYDQIPHIVINHPETNPEHQALMRALYKVLKDVSYPIVYSNEQLAIDCKMSLRNVERRLPELNKMLLLNITGRGYQRRIRLGLLFSTTANFASTTAKSDPHNRQYGGHYNPSYNPSSKEDLSFSSLNHFETKEIELCIKQGFSLSSDFKYLQPLLDEAKKNER